MPIWEAGYVPCTTACSEVMANTWSLTFSLFSRTLASTQGDRKCSPREATPTFLPTACSPCCGPAYLHVVFSMAELKALGLTFIITHSPLLN